MKHQSDTINLVENTFNITLNHNQTREIARLFFEIKRRERIDDRKIIDDLQKQFIGKKFSHGNLIGALKKSLIFRRFPLTIQQQTLNPADIYLPLLNQSIEHSRHANKHSSLSKFIPAKIFVETSVKNSYLVKNFHEHFPQIPIQEIDYHSSYIKQHPFSLNDLKKSIVFIVKERRDFIKPCPCTKNHLNCGYWILNLGFGCPYDCSYCFLQNYANSPGIILPGNLEDFFDQFDKFQQKLISPIRIGTGEFCDSLALDHITEYSKKLIAYFKNKNVLFELKTKSIDIDNLLTISSEKNIVISWSINVSDFSANQELFAPNINQRLQAAAALQKYGWRIGFHFDPIIHGQYWPRHYEQLINQLYETIKPPLAWISLGTLRCQRELKNICERRFPGSNIFYGELFMGQDKKLRYPEFLRVQIYQSMIKWIRRFDQQTPIYLCMENKKIWASINDKFTETVNIEKYILEKFNNPPYCRDF